MPLLVVPSCKLAIFYSFGCAHEPLIRLAHEARTGEVLQDVYSSVDPMTPSLSDLSEDWGLSGVAPMEDYSFVAVMGDPWTRLVSLYKTFMVRLKRHSLLERKYKFVNGIQFPFQDLVKLLSLFRPDVVAPVFRPQTPSSGYPSGTKILKMEEVHGWLTAHLKAQGQDPKTLKTLEDLRPRALKEATKTTVLSRAFVGHLPPSSFALSSMPPMRSFYNEELWAVVKELYAKDLETCPTLAIQGFPSLKESQEPKLV